MRVKQKLAAVLAACMVLTMGGVTVMAGTDSPNSGNSGGSSTSGGTSSEGSSSSTSQYQQWISASATDGVSVYYSYGKATNTDGWYETYHESIDINADVETDIAKAITTGLAYSNDTVTASKLPVTAYELFVYSTKKDVTIPAAGVAKASDAGYWIEAQYYNATSNTTTIVDIDNVTTAKDLSTANVKTQNLGTTSAIATLINKNSTTVKGAEVVISGSGSLGGDMYVSIENRSAVITSYVAYDKSYIYYYDASTGKLDYMPEMGGYVGFADTKIGWVWMQGATKSGTYIITDTYLDDAITSGKTEVVTLDDNATKAEVTTALTAAITAAKEDSATVVKTEVPAGVKVEPDVFKAAKEAGVTLVIETPDNNIKWSFSNFAVTMSADFDPTVEIGDGLVQNIDTAMKNSDTVYVTVAFAYDGSLPGETEVTLDVSTGDFKDGDTLYLYYYNETTKLFEKIDSCTMTGGYGTFTMTHCSDYIITNEVLDAALTTAASSDGTTTTAPKTADMAGTVILFAVMLMAGAGIFTLALTRRKRY